MKRSPLPALAQLACLCLAVLLGLTAAATAGGIGVVVLHGKTGMPGQHAKLAAALKAAGYAVETPKMCWSRDRIFDKAYADCLGEVDAAIGRLKSGGRLTAEIARRLQAGLNPAKVAEHVLAGIRGGDFYVFTHPEMKDGLEARFGGIMAAMEKAGRG